MFADFFSDDQGSHITYVVGFSPTLLQCKLHRRGFTEVVVICPRGGGLGLLHDRPAVIDASHEQTAGPVMIVNKVIPLQPNEF